MTVEIKSPVFPESVADGVIVTWHKKEGEFVEQDEALVDIETDKVVLEVPAPESGVIKKIHKAEGTTVIAQELLGEIEAGAGSKPALQVKEAEKPAVQESTANGTPVAPTASPAARKMASRQEIDLASVAGSGKGGRILKEDLLSTKTESKSAPSSETVSVTALGGREEKRVPMTRLRAKIAERLVSAQQTAAMLTTFNEVNLKAVRDLRAKYQESFEKQHGTRLGFMSFFVKAAVEALRRFPEVNASIDGSDIVYHGYYDIGVAVSSPRGLVVPILRNAEELSLAGIEKSIKEFGEKAKNGKLTLEEMTGGTFTISNGGVFGSMLSTPILNPPQSAILGMHAIIERPIAENGEIVIRPMMYLAVSYDHRIIDGREAVSFLKTIKELLEDPSRLLLDI